MLKSMYSGISGMKANQTKMDVIGNNVANVGTTSFKKSSARFTDALNQTLIHSSAPSGGIGGINPGQVGIGTKVSGIYKYMGQGSLQPTGRPTDLALDGDGFFAVEQNGQIAFTRDGSFSLDSKGDLVTADGYRVTDTNGNPINIPTEVEVDVLDDTGTPTGARENKKVISFNISKDGSISLALEDGTKTNLQETLKNPDGTEIAGSEYDVAVRVATFINPEGLEAINGNLYIPSANSGAPNYTGEQGSIIQGAIEMSNVDLSEEFTDMIITTRSFQAASKVITTSDELLQEIINLKR